MLAAVGGERLADEAGNIDIVGIDVDVVAGAAAVTAQHLDPAQWHGPLPGTRADCSTVGIIADSWPLGNVGGRVAAAVGTFTTVIGAFEALASEVMVRS